MSNQGLAKFTKPEFLYARVCQKKHGSSGLGSKYAQRVFVVVKMAVLLCRTDGKVSRCIPLDRIDAVIAGKDQAGNPQIVVRGAPKSGGQDAEPDFLVKLAPDPDNAAVNRPAACGEDEVRQLLAMMEEMCMASYNKPLRTEMRSASVKQEATLSKNSMLKQADAKSKMQMCSARIQHVKVKEHAKRIREQAAAAVEAAQQQQPPSHQQQASLHRGNATAATAMSSMPGSPMTAASTVGGYGLDEVLAMLDDRMDKKINDCMRGSYPQSDMGSAGPSHPDSPIRGGLHNHTHHRNGSSPYGAYSPPRHGPESSPRHGPESSPFRPSSASQYSPFQQRSPPPAGPCGLFQEPPAQANDEDYWVRFVHRWEAVAGEAADAL